MPMYVCMYVCMTSLVLFARIGFSSPFLVDAWLRTMPRESDNPFDAARLLFCFFCFCFRSGGGYFIVPKRLGDYEGDQFKDTRVRAPLDRFQQAIEAIETDMVAE